MTQGYRPLARSRAAAKALRRHDLALGGHLDPGDDQDRAGDVAADLEDLPHDRVLGPLSCRQRSAIVAPRTEWWDLVSRGLSDRRHQPELLQHREHPLLGPVL